MNAHEPSCCRTGMREANATATPTGAKPSVELRPGVFRPDWSVVTSPAAEQALAGRADARPGLIDKWLHALSGEADRTWRAVLELYGALGRPPRGEKLSAATGLSEPELADVLRGLCDHDLLDLAPDGTIRYVYPFTEAQTGHRVRLGGHVIAAMCAIDALGVGAMYGRDIDVESACRWCGGDIRVATADRGRALADVSPPGAVVWYDFAYDGSAAVSCCPAMALFCS
ncbi:MAG TPA: organomercurial lyase, partial [Microvirga sp.]|nr:organomercurial lyase [Microvirga sp.]